MQKIIVHEVGLRDGLQMEQRTVPTETKLHWIQSLIAARVDILQVGSFVHPEKVPQMADTDKLFGELVAGGKRSGITTLSALVLNERGLERGMACGVEMFCMGVSASETHSRKNTGMPVGEATERIIAMANRASASGYPVQVSVQSAFGCGYEGHVPRDRVLRIVARYLDAGIRKISLADTAGHATPDRVKDLFGAIFAIESSVEAACHFHNTYGLGLANCYAAMEAGVTNIESSIGGLGGCPFTKVAGGNVCTEDFVHMLHRMNFRRDIDLQKLLATAGDVARFFERELPGMVVKAGPIRDSAPMRETSAISTSRPIS